MIIDSGSHPRAGAALLDRIDAKATRAAAVLSFGTAGCNLACKFCQNWDMSKSREMDTLADRASPTELAAAAERLGCASIAYTYNDRTVFLEYAIDAAQAARERGIRSVAVTAGYICPKPRAELFEHMDAANIDLKGFSDEFYRKVCGGELGAVLETLQYVYRETRTWLEITTLLIPGYNDSDSELQAMCAWLAEHLGPDVPLHFTAFHPDWKMLEVSPTWFATLSRARQIALREGLHYVYTGNVRDPEGGSTWCHGCGAKLIGRVGYDLDHWSLTPDGNCAKCGTTCVGVFAAAPGHWGSRRSPVRLSA